MDSPLLEVVNKCQLKKIVIKIFGDRKQPQSSNNAGPGISGTPRKIDVFAPSGIHRLVT